MARILSKPASSRFLQIIHSAGARGFDEGQGIIAVGAIAAGVIAVGGLGFGVVSVGGLAVGLVDLGGLAVGGVAVGGLAAGFRSSGGLAIGHIRWRVTGLLANFVTLGSRTGFTCEDRQDSGNN